MTVLIDGVTPARARIREESILDPMAGKWIQYC